MRLDASEADPGKEVGDELAGVSPRCVGYSVSAYKRCELCRDDRHKTREVFLILEASKALAALCLEAQSRVPGDGGDPLQFDGGLLRNGLGSLNNAVDRFAG